jgi:methyltransferase (TIGR00027 family)
VVGRRVEAIQESVDHLGGGMLRAMQGPSATALMVAAYRARATAREEAICNDPWAAALAGEEGQELARRYDETFPHMELWIALRTAFFDSRVQRLAGPGGIDQVVLLGAGFDTRAARLGRPGLRFFEVDRGPSQEAKLGALGRVDGYPVASATYVTCNFEREDFLDRLVHAGLSTERPALFLWEGVTAYLTEAAVRGTLRRIATGTHAASVLVFEHLRRKIVSGDVRDEKDKESRAFVSNLGEPLRFGVDYPLPMLFQEGFRRVRMLTFDEVCLDLTGTYARERVFRYQGLVVTSRAADVGA